MYFDDNKLCETVLMAVVFRERYFFLSLFTLSHLFFFAFLSPITLFYCIYNTLCIKSSSLFRVHFFLSLFLALSLSFLCIRCLCLQLLCPNVLWYAVRCYAWHPYKNSGMKIRWSVITHISLTAIYIWKNCDTQEREKKRVPAKLAGWVILLPFCIRCDAVAVAAFIHIRVNEQMNE